MDTRGGCPSVRLFVLQSTRDWVQCCACV